MAEGHTVTAIPVIVLTGALGAGKTTVLNRLLAADRIAGENPALIINEFGKVGVDGQLVRGSFDLVEVTGGSVFCACTQAQLALAFADIAAKAANRLVLIESTGVSAFANLQDTLRVPAVADAFRVRANVCVIDALNFTKVAPILKVVARQPRSADGLLISKTDLAADEDVPKLQGLLGGMNPHAPQRLAPFDESLAEFVLGLEHARSDEALATTPPEDIVSCAIRSDDVFDRDHFVAAVRQLRDRLLRLKGNVDFGPAGRKFVEVVFDRITEAEPTSETSPRTALAAVGWRIDSAHLRAALETACRKP
jgi:G3E family GTPase